MRDLTKTEQLQLLKFVCSFAWTDLQVQPEERAYIEKLAESLELSEDERGSVREWLAVPPPAEEVDPTQIRPEHRQAFYAAVKDLVEADGRVLGSERDSLELFRELLHG